MQAYRGIRGIAPLIANLGTIWMWVVHAPAALPPRKKPRHLLDMRLCGPQSRSGRFGEGKYILPLPELKPGSSNQ
jgi:hypothetical protein